MKRIGVLGGVGPQATIDFEERLHAASQRLIPQNWSLGYPPLVVWYHRGFPIQMDGDGRPVTPTRVDPDLVEGAARLGTLVDFLAIPCNSAHVGLSEIEAAARRPVLSMVNVVLDEVARRGWATVGVLGFNGAPGVYLTPLRERGIACLEIDPALQVPLDAGLRAVMEGGVGPADGEAARAAVASLRERGAAGIVLGCTEIPLLLGDREQAEDLLNPAALLAEAAVRYAIADRP
jgi:aspartate racemase